MKVTIFENIKETRKPYWVELDTIFRRIASGNVKDKIQKIRSSKDKEARNKLKAELPSICFSGMFDERNNSALRKHSGLICLDFDNVDPEETKEQLSEISFIFAAFTSPSGNGVKALVKIPIDNHLASFLALQEEFPIIDSACKDVARVCYESWDSKLYVNPEAEIYTKQIEIQHASVEVSKPLTDKDKVYELIKKWLEKKGEYFTEGNRNNFLCKIASACNRFGISKEDAKQYLTYDYVNGSSNFNYTEFEQVLNSVYRNYSNQFATASFEDSEVVETTSKKNIGQEILDEEPRVKDVIYLDDVVKDMLYDFENGIKKGETTGFDFIDPHFRWIRGELTLLHGIGNHGKSTFFSRLCNNKANDSNWRFAIFSPEQYPPTYFYNELIQMRVGKSVMKGDYQMSKEEYIEAAVFVNEHFFYVFPENNDPTPEYINERFSELIRKHKVDVVVVDPFNQLFHDYTERDDKYLSKILTSFKRFALMNNVHYVMIAHPNGRIAKTVKGDLEMPYFTELAGGMMWANKCDNILCYHRPTFKSDPTSPKCQFSAQKIKKQQINGKPGTVDMEYDFKTFSFGRWEDNPDYANTDFRNDINPF